MDEQITLAHGAGGTKYRELIREVFLPYFSCGELDSLGDSAVCKAGERIAFTTDGYVIKPLFFPGGDIGRLAVSGTVNDLAVSGAEPKYISVSMIIESGFPIERLRRIVSSMANTAGECGVRIVTGDTKVVERGQADGIYIATAGVGVFDPLLGIPPQRICAGDAIIVSGAIASHGMAVLAAREGLEFSPRIESDVQPLAALISKVRHECGEIHAMRDPTRGGVASVLCEWAEDSGVDIIVDGEAVPMLAGVKAACELLGMNPMYMANEGVALFALPHELAEGVVSVLRSTEQGADAKIVGRVVAGNGRVFEDTGYGAKRRIIPASGELLPRIC